jgi:acylphosphatase
MSKRRIHVWISGRVQGVFFRANVQEEAGKRDLAGWVKNLPDGRVEAVFEGDADKVDAMLGWCRIGTPLSRVEKVEVREESFQGESHTFEVRY